ncbi:MAG: very short patch repair endonuclease [Syntrophobacteraceae bacterium]|jgi:DNA mismatch endonuclease (patch repair protein)|nr:very short patch repair endonuclease [Syntrophobacteraceae bacterium]
MSKSVAKAPRYDSYRSASPAASRAKSRNKGKDTAAELLLRQALWAIGVRYRLHVAGLPGKPDIVLPRQKIAVFIDGDFWHGRNWQALESKLRHRANPDYWVAKIKYNITRDLEQTKALKDQGWTVLRLWETEVKKDPGAAAEKVLAALDSSVVT